MKITKFLTVGCVAALCHMAPASAAAKEDFDLSNPACTIALNDNVGTRFINVNYIRAIYVSNNKEGSRFAEHDHEKVLQVSMASNYSNATSSFNIGYRSKADAIKAMNELNDKINDCQYDAVQKRKARKKQ
jgi:hypothetical protein